MGDNSEGLLFGGAVDRSREAIYRLNFYDAVRLGQEIASELENGVVFFEPNLVVVRSVTEEEMERAVGQLVRSSWVASLTPDE